MGLFGNFDIFIEVKTLNSSVNVVGMHGFSEYRRNFGDQLLNLVHYHFFSFRWAGQPRRHLLTTGWSAFVNKKKLVSGDAVLFLRYGNLLFAEAFSCFFRFSFFFFLWLLYLFICDRVADGELRLGIRRAAQVKIGTAFPAPYCQQFTSSSMASVAHAISTRRVFNICYNPRYFNQPKDFP